MNKRLRITTILGTRPEIIRLSSIIQKFDIYFEHRIVLTGQNNQAELSTNFFTEFDIREPDAYLGLSVESLGSFLGALFSSIEKEFIANRPDAIMLLGDTNSSLISILAKRMKIPVYHLEAGNRSFDLNVPEEINRKIIDHSSDFNLCYTRHAARNLEKEGFPSRQVAVIGSPLREVIEFISPKIRDSKILDQLKIISGNYFLISLHRQENIDAEDRLNNIISCLNNLAREFEIPIIVSAHPRFADKLSNLQISLHSNIKLMKPFGYVDYMKLQKESKLVVSDSGSVSEESAIADFRSVTLRDSMERPEALEAGSIILTGTNPANFVNLIKITIDSEKSRVMPDEYLIPDTSTRVLNYLLSTIGQFEFWNGLRKS